MPMAMIWCATLDGMGFMKQQARLPDKVVTLGDDSRLCIPAQKTPTGVVRWPVRVGGT